MLAQQLKTQRLDQNLSILEVSIRAGLDASLVSRYENGNRIPTRDHILRLANALSINQEALLTTWLSEKMKKVWIEEDNAGIREKALSLLNGTIESQSLFEQAGTRISQKQEEKLNSWLTDLSPVRHTLNRHRRILQEWIAFEHQWSEEEIEQVITAGKTVSGHDFPAHLRLHTMHQWLKDVESLGSHLQSSLQNKLMKQLIPDWSDIEWPGNGLNLSTLARFYTDLTTNHEQEWRIAMNLCLLRWGFPLCPLGRAFPKEVSIGTLAENLGDWLIAVLRRYREEIED
ncbi:MAG: helix-turn-helix domain-containing protein [Bacteroidetes bacterium]|nr:helix-turn-helix domain-containing protein [Bacteroidota bacterium]